MITSINLASVSFLGQTDSSRLQMSAKQLSQCVTFLGNKRPLVIGKKWYFLSESPGYRYSAKFNGEVLYSNSDFMIIIYHNKNETLKILDCPKIKHTSHGFASTLRYKSKIGSFRKGKTLYEYDCFFEGVPTYGKTFSVAFLPFFGYDTQDAIAVSESFARNMRCVKTQTIEIPIFETSVFQHMYEDSKYGFLPEIGQRINEHVVAFESVLKNSNINKRQGLNLLNISSTFENTFRLNSVPIISKLQNAKISKIKIHNINPHISLIDQKLKQSIINIRNDYISEIKTTASELNKILPRHVSKQLLSKYYIMHPKQAIPKTEKLAYVLEITLTKESQTKIGDKISNRYANKGVVSLIFPDEFRPINSETGEPIDVIMSPLSVFSRMNLGQILEGMFSKVIQKIENNILKGEDIPENLIELSKLAELLGDKEYQQEIEILAEEIAESPKLESRFLRSIVHGGLYFEIENFLQINIETIQSKIKEIFNIETNDKIIMPKSLLNYVKSKINIDIDLPDSNLVFNSVFNAPLYMVKLMHLAESKLMHRDFGNYQIGTKQPVSDRDNLRGKGSRIGGMEFDGLLAHEAISTTKELRTVKSDAIALKKQLLEQFLITGQYKLPDVKIQSHTKLIIQALLTFLKRN